jgi:hypothetical protein
MRGPLPYYEPRLTKVKTCLTSRRPPVRFKASMERKDRRAALFLLGAFVASVLALWAHDLSGHEPEGPDCGECSLHFCTDEGHHSHEPCVFCTLRASGHRKVQERGPWLHFRIELAVEVPEARRAIAPFIDGPAPRGPPAA